MTSWFTKSLLPLFFRTAQRSVQALPASLLRIRPFGVYEIRLPRSVTEHSQPDADSPCLVRWIASQDEARCLSELATAENIADWDGTTRRAIALWKNDLPVGVAWIAAESFAEEELGLHYRLAEDEVWLFASVVAPASRRQGHYRQLLEFLIAELSQDSSEVQRILLGVSVGNTPSQNAHARQGAQQLGTIFAAKCLGLAFCKVGGQVQRISKRSWAWRCPVELAVDQPVDPM